MKMKKILCSILAIAMILGTMGTVVFAENTSVAAIGVNEYATLQAAFEAAQDDDTITLLSNVTITKETAVNSGGDWYEGVYYTGDKSFTVDLGGFTVTQNGQVNDYLILLKNDGEKDNTITFKNGTIDAGTSAYCAICTSTASKNKITINTENINIIGENSNGSVLKIRGGAVLNVNNGTVITGKDSYLAIENANATVNVYDGAKIYMEGTTSYNGCLIGVGYNGTVNVYGGYGEGTKGVMIAMTSGGTINVYGGTWIADTDGTNVAGNDSVLISQSDKNTYTDAGDSVVNVYGGTFTGSYNCYGNATGDAQLNISGGAFSQDPTDYLVEGCNPSKNEDGSFGVNDTRIAEVNGTYYTTLADAVSEATAGDTITILQNTTIAKGETVNVENKNVTAAEGVTLTVNGNFDIYGECTLNLATVEGAETVNFRDGAIIKDSNIGGNVFVAGNVTFRGRNTFKMLYDFGTLTDYYGTEANMEWTVEQGASVTLTDKSRYGLGYGDKITVNGNLTDASTARDTLTADDASLFMHGLVAQESVGWEQKSSLTVNDAYVIIGSNNSFGNKAGNYGGSYTITFDNSVLDASRITFYETPSDTVFHITDSDVKMGTFMTNDKDSVFNITNSKIVSTTTTNGNDEGNYHAGTMNVVNSDITYSAPVKNTGTITVDSNSTITAPSISGAGTIEIDVSDYNGYGELDIIKADLSDFEGTVKAVGGENANVSIVDGKIVYHVSPVGGPIVGYTDTDRIWGETRANAKESYVVQVYSDETLLGYSSLNNIGGIINGDVTVTWSVKLGATPGGNGYWDTTWVADPTMDKQPTHVALVVDGTEVSRTKIKLNSPDDLKKVHAAITDDNGKILRYATTLQNAFDSANSGETIQLLCDVELDKAVSFAKDTTVTLDGNGYTIKPSKNSKETNSALILGQGGDSTRANRVYNLKDIVFEGWTTDHVVRLQGTTSLVEGCVFKNCAQELRYANGQQTTLGLLTLNFTDATVKNCIFENNDCLKAIDINSWGDNSLSKVVIEDTIFQNNTASAAGLVLYSDGAGMTVKNSEFISNTVNTTANAATLYGGFQNGIKIEGNLFKDNTVITSGTSKRVAGGVFTGAADADNYVSRNVFVGNSATAAGVPAASSIAASPYYAPININDNYWGGSEPANGVDYINEYPTQNELAIDTYYAAYSIAEDGTLVFENKNVVNAKSLALVFEKNVTESNADEGYLVYDIVIKSGDSNLINRLNTADFTFAISSDKVAYEILESNAQVDINNVNNLTNRYEFHYKGKDNANDTAESIVIGQVKFTGYDSFVFSVADADTNLVTATTVDDNIVDEFKAGADLDVSATVSDEIIVPTRTLTINIDFPNAVKDNDIAYQDMTVVISGEDIEDITYHLGKGEEACDVAMNNGDYVITVANALTLNASYDIVVTGAGYRTARYTVRMTDNKTVNFWNNVKDADAAVEEGKAYAKLNYLAGDIVKDNKINTYDLSAVVSYFGETGLSATNNKDYAKYDLNRDGFIDSKDVAIVLVSWGN